MRSIAGADLGDGVVEFRTITDTASPGAGTMGLLEKCSLMMHLEIVAVLLFLLLKSLDYLLI